MTERTLTFTDHDEIRTLFGPRDQFLKQVRDQVGIDVVVRGDELRLRGEEDQVAEGLRVLGELRGIVSQSGRLTEQDVNFVLSGMPKASETTGEPSQTSVRAAAVVERSNGNGNGHSTAEASPAATGTLERSARNEHEIDVFERAKSIRPRTAGQSRYVKAIRENELVFCRGPAGSGKTYLAVAMAVNALRTELVRKIVLVRPAVEAGERLGFLPGDMLAKVNPYLRPLLDALNDILDFEQVKTYMAKDLVEIVPLAYMRGRTLNNTFMILDEAQNTTATQMKMFLTRMGTDSRIVVTGDATQTDLPTNTTSGLVDAIRRLSHVEGIETVELDGRDIVRHRLVREIVAAYDDGEQGGRVKRRAR